MKTNRYMDRALKSRDPRYAKVLSKLGYEPLSAAEERKRPARRKVDPLDHDQNGRKGGAMKPADVDGDLARLRQDYEAKFGKRPFMGWDAAALRAKLAEAPAAMTEATEAGRYERRDMRAAD